MPSLATPFADVEAALAIDTMRMLANATVLVALPADAAGASFAGIFDNAYAFIDVASGLESSAPAFSALVADLPGAVADALDSGEAVNLEVHAPGVRPVCYDVVEAKPDGDGWIVMRLRK